MSQVEGRRAPEELRHRVVDGPEELQRTRQLLGARHLGRPDLNIGAALSLLE
jgi:hypothetical protein